MHTFRVTHRNALFEVIKGRVSELFEYSAGVSMFILNSSIHTP